MSKLVLLVDDDQSLLECLSELIRQEAINVVCAENGDEALHWLRHSGRLPDFIFIDLKMPVMDGETFLEEKSKAGTAIAGIPVLVLTAGRTDVRGRSVVGVLRKPFGIGDFLPYVESLARGTALPEA